AVVVGDRQLRGDAGNFRCRLAARLHAPLFVAGFFRELGGDRSAFEAGDVFLQRQLSGDDDSGCRVVREGEVALLDTRDVGLDAARCVDFVAVDRHGQVGRLDALDLAVGDPDLAFAAEFLLAVPQLHGRRLEQLRVEVELSFELESPAGGNLARDAPFADT